MSNSAQQMYALSIDQTASVIIAGGADRSVLVQGHMGTGKTALLRMVAKALPTHTPVYFDCTTKDVGDLFIPNFATMDGQSYVSFVPNEEFGIHLKKPVILMFDELGKANPAVKTAVNRTMLEHVVGNSTLPEGSIVFATTNLSGEGVGDLLPAHTRNRITVVTMRKPSSEEWLQWGINNDLSPVVMGWVRDNPQVMQSFEDVKDPDENPYIFHPRSTRAAFVTPRSLEAASDWVKNGKGLDAQTLTATLMGTLGDRAAMDLMAYVALGEKLPTRDQIKKDPQGAPVPSSAAAVCMVVFRALSSMSPDFVSPWMEYLDRLDAEAQGLFANGVRHDKYSHRSTVMTAKPFTKWAANKAYLFSADRV